MNPFFITYATAGNGHRVAALALREAFIEKNLPTVIADVLHFSFPLFRLVYSNLYEVLGEHAHGSCEAMYRLTDRPVQESRIVRLIDWISQRNVTHFADFVRENGIQDSVCTHFMPMLILARLKSEGLYEGRLYACITDFDLYHMWVHSAVDRYFVATEGIREKLVEQGIPSEKIEITGIPVRKAFREKSFVHEGLPPEGTLRILFSASAISDTKVIRLLEMLGELDFKVSVTVVAGRNRSLWGRLRFFTPPPNVQMESFDFVEDIEMLMSRCDLMITKPGGLITSEALCTGIPMLLFSPIPLQETQNARYLESQGVGIYCEEIADIVSEIRRLNADRNALLEMRKRALALAKPDAAVRIVDAVLERTLPREENLSFAEFEDDLDQSETEGDPTRPVDSDSQSG